MNNAIKGAGGGGGKMSMSMSRKSQRSKTTHTNTSQVRGSTTTIIHTDINKLSLSLFDVAEISLLSKYYNEIASRETGRSPKLPRPNIISKDDESCMLLESFRYSSNKKQVFRMVQRVVKVESDNKKRVEIAFCCITKEENITGTSTENINYFKLYNLTVIDNSYPDNGNYVLNKMPHSQTEMIIYVEIRYDDEKLVTLTTLNKMLQNVLGIAVSANTHYDRSSEVDKAVSDYFISSIMPKLNRKGLNDVEKASIAECAKTLKWDDKNVEWKRMRGSLNDDVEKFTTREGKLVVVKGVAIIDERTEALVSYMIHFNSNERNKIAYALNGNVERSLDNDYENHSSHVTTEAKSPRPLANRRFGDYVTWGKGWGGMKMLSLLPTCRIKMMQLTRTEWLQVLLRPCMLLNHWHPEYVVSLKFKRLI